MRMQLRLTENLLVLCTQITKYQSMRTSHVLFKIWPASSKIITIKLGTIEA